MKQLIVATALVLAAGAAHAADVMQEAPVAASFDWSGAYIGVNAGGGFGKFKDSISFGPRLDMTASGFLGGIQAGYNWQSGQMIYGVETDFQGSAVDASVSDFFGFTPKTKVDWFGTLRARIGYTPIDRFMIYGTGGLAYGQVKTEFPFFGPFMSSSSKTRAGWTVGAGAEYAINTNWTIKSEYLYTDLGNSTAFSSGPITLKSDVAFHTVRVGLNYKF
ncbi:outer membrane protein [Mesorhizobium sp. GbtcB19]|uniref:outer membrane protein n=1 Tax=Mesorhizobium sp. GbtcB19 TaxID=2824764 RepID=UPI001C2F2461|nr:outer membrane protein [Mesorhizobium sp. GbtcB19]